MSVDKFGRYASGFESNASGRGPPGEGFALTDRGDYDMMYKRLCNVGQPKEANDAVTIDSLKDYAPVSTTEGKWTMKRYRVSECGDPIEVLDAVNFRTLLVALRNLGDLLNLPEMPYKEWLDKLVPRPDDILTTNTNDDIENMVKARMAEMDTSRSNITADEDTKKQRLPIQLHLKDVHKRNDHPPTEEELMETDEGLIHTTITKKVL